MKKSHKKDPRTQAPGKEPRLGIPCWETAKGGEADRFMWFHMSENEDERGREVSTGHKNNLPSKEEEGVFHESWCH